MKQLERLMRDVCAVPLFCKTTTTVNERDAAAFVTRLLLVSLSLCAFSLALKAKTVTCSRFVKTWYKLKKFILLDR